MKSLKSLLFAGVFAAIVLGMGVKFAATSTEAGPPPPPDIHVLGSPLNFPSGSSGNVATFEITGVPSPLRAYNIVGDIGAPGPITLTAAADISGIPATNLCPSQTVNTPNPGNFEIACGSTNAAGVAGPTISLATITFNCTAVGSVTVTFTAVDANDTTLTSFSPTSTNGTINCTAAPTSTPVPTATPLPEGPVFVKDTDIVADGIQTEANLWLCQDNPATGVVECQGPGEGELVIAEVFFNPGGVGLGAFEFQVKYDHKVFDMVITSAIEDTNSDTVINDSDSYLASTGRTVLCDSLITENFQYFACGSADLSPPYDQAGPSDVGPNNVAFITLTPDADMYFRIRPTSMNGVVRIMLDENCEAATELGEPFPGSVDGGLAPVCDDATVTVRILEGDLNTDCLVGIDDIQNISDRYGAFFGRLDYDPWFDLEPKITDFDIDIKDIQFVAGRLFSSCTDPVPAQAPAQAYSSTGL
jgi:hypothetical protein